jgi:hypothetical protein
MTSIPESLEAAVRAFADREHLTLDEAVERLIGYGLNDVAENDRYLESLKPHNYRVEEGTPMTDADGDPVLSEWAYMFAATTLDRARDELIEFATEEFDGPARDEAERAVRITPLGEAVRIGGRCWRITKAS